MEKTLKIIIHQDPTLHVENFLEGWQQIGSFKQTSELSYLLIGRDNMSSRLELQQTQLIISGQIPSESFMLIDSLAKACEADRVIEGDVIDKNQTQQNNFNNTFANQAGIKFEMPLGMQQLTTITNLSKAKVIALLIIALPLLIIMIPVVILFAIFKIIMFKLRF